MKTKRIPITISSDLLDEIDRNIAGTSTSRSRFMADVLRALLDANRREALNARDIQLINSNLEYLVREAEDVNLYQASIDFSSEEP